MARKARKIRVYQLVVPGGILVLSEQEAIKIGDELIANGLVGPANLRRLAFGDQSIERIVRPMGTIKKNR